MLIALPGGFFGHHTVSGDGIARFPLRRESIGKSYPKRQDFPILSQKRIKLKNAKVNMLSDIGTWLCETRLS